jgi:hypothetical protein
MVAFLFFGGTSFILLSSVGALLLRAYSVEEKSFAFATVTFSPSRALFVVVSLTIGAIVARRAYKRAIGSAKQTA